MKDPKHRRGDRKDAYRVRDIDPMHAIFPYAMPDRTDNEAVMNVIVDLTEVNKYLAEKNADSPEFPYTFFHVICAAVAKTVALRPWMNRFYSGGRLYERKEVSLSFTVKKRFVDDAPEGLAIVKVKRDSDLPPIEQVYQRVKKIVYGIRKENDATGMIDIMDAVSKLPPFVIRFIAATLKWLESHGWYPQDMMNEDPFYTSVFLANLGSIGVDANYHHLSNWGTNSFFCVVGEKKKRMVETENGEELRETVRLALTVDERIADGVYYARSVKLFRYIIENPHLLDEPIMTPVDEEVMRLGGKSK